jgi:general stress protein 26
MALLEVEESNRMWFISGRDSGKVHEIAQEKKVLVVCQRGESCHLSINGLAHLEADRARIAKLWKESFKVWFPEGKDDPNIVLIAVQPVDAEYWDNGGSNMVKYLVETTKAYLTGERPKVEEGEQHGRVVPQQG